MVLLWLFTALLASIAGFALARGGICAVAAVRQVVEEGRWAFFVSFFECAAWALLALILADALGAMAVSTWPAHMSLSLALIGGALFGVGALIVGACAFGAVGHLAAGDLSFLALAPGFLLGAWLAHQLGAEAQTSAATNFVLTGVWLSLLLAVLITFAVWRIWTAWRSAPGPTQAAARLAHPNWPPALAMAVIAFANVGLLLIIFAWPYTVLLTDLAIGSGTDIALRTALVFVFVAGAIVGTISARRFKLRAPTIGAASTRFVGGGFMGFGAALIPGGNDALVLLGLPLLQPEALAAYAAMVAVIALGFIARKYRGAPRT